MYLDCELFTSDLYLQAGGEKMNKQDVKVSHFFPPACKYRSLVNSSQSEVFRCFLLGFEHSSPKGGSPGSSVALLIWLCLSVPKAAIHSSGCLSHPFQPNYSSPSLTGWNPNAGCPRWVSSVPRSRFRPIAIVRITVGQASGFASSMRT